MGTAIISATPKVNTARKTHKEMIHIHAIKNAENTRPKFLKNNVTLLFRATNIFRFSTVIYGSQAKNRELRIVRQIRIMNIATNGIRSGIANTAFMEKYKIVNIVIS
jgi:hypothetical protein